jgi:hypothetical protein
MKIFISIIAIALLILLVVMNKSREVQTMNTAIADGILQSIEESKKTDCEHFIVPIKGTNNNVAFRDDGTVFVHIGNSEQTFEVTSIQQMHRFYDLHKLLQSPR